MKKIIASSIALFLFMGVTFAQKFAFVDTDYILQNIPSYNAAQEELNKVSEAWEGEITVEYEAIEQLYKTYQSERVLLTDEMKKKREEEIIAKERQVKELQSKYFGPESDLSTKRQELVKPIQDALYKAVKELSRRIHVEGGSLFFMEGTQPLVVGTAALELYVTADHFDDIRPVPNLRDTCFRDSTGHLPSLCRGPTHRREPFDRPRRQRCLGSCHGGDPRIDRVSRGHLTRLKSFAFPPRRAPF